MDTKEKLMELIDDGIACPDGRGPFDLDCQGCKYEKVRDCQLARLADYLIAHGVTVQKWIPVAERLPDNIANKVIVCCKNGYVGFGHYEKFRGNEVWYNLENDRPFTDWNLDDCETYEVTHWMPLPEPPKEG